MGVHTTSVTRWGEVDEEDLHLLIAQMRREHDRHWERCTIHPLL